MAKRVLLVLILFAVLAGSVFSESRHESGDLLLGLDIGWGFTPKIFKLSAVTLLGNYAWAFDVGLNLDFYLFNWLSLNSGVFVHGGPYLLLKEATTGNVNFLDMAKTPICLTFPVMAHINIPGADVLYLGAGLTLNIPVASMTDSLGIDTKGTFFAGLPIDFGFDFIKAGGGGSRFFFRITPEFHKSGTPVLVGFMWQLYNFKLR